MATASEVPERVVEGTAGDSLLHLTCRACDAGVGRTETALCGKNVRGWVWVVRSRWQAGDVLCALCEDVEVCPVCGALQPKREER